MRHVVWDWNGTLFDDFELNVAAVSDSCTSVGGSPVSAADYRRHYTRPIEVFYERLLGRSLRGGEWPLLDRTYHESYHRRLDSAALVPGAEEALGRVADAGLTQSLLSMWEHRHLLALVDHFGLDRFFVRIDGQESTGGGFKHEHLERHLAALAEALGHLATSDVVMVGDTVDDAEAAARVGIACVLVENGPHEPSVLAATGRPVVASLVEALRAAGVTG